MSRRADDIPLRQENRRLRQRVVELEQTLHAILRGEVDALVLQGPQGPQTYTLKGADHAYRAIVEAMSEGAVRMLPDGAVLYCNARMASLLQRLPEQVMGARLGDFVEPAARADFETRLEAGGRWEAVLLAFDGTHVPVQFSVQPFSAGDQPGLLAVVSDLTAQAEDRRVLRESEEKFRYLFEHSPIGKSLTEVTGEMHANPALCAMLGYTEDELRRCRWQDVTSPDDVGAVQQADESLVSGAATETRFLKRYLHKDGSVVWADVITALRRDPAGRPMYFMTNVVDITERKRAEEALLNSESHLRQILEALPQLVWTCRADGPCDYLSPQWLAYTGLPAPPQLGYGWLEQLHPDDRQATIDRWLAVAPKGESFDIEFRIRRHDGVHRWFQTRAIPLRDKSGQIVKWIGSNTDIEDLKQATAVLARGRDALEAEVAARTALLAATNHELEAFAYSVSHDLRAPLRAIDGFSRKVVANSAERLDGEGRRLLQVVRNEAQRMGRLIDDLLDFSRMGRREMDPRRVDMDALVRGVVAELRDGTPGRAIEFRVLPLPPAAGDAAMLRQVWVNLIGNAVKFTSGRALAHIEVGGRTEGDRLAYWVKDDGAGFDMRYADKLFGVFQRLHHQDEFEGTGVGLATAQRILNRHQGHIRGLGQPDAGATFQFDLPASVEPARTGEAA